MLLGAVGALVLLLAQGAGSASALTYGGALEYGRYWSETYWGYGSTPEYCTGPYENVRGRTQWACYGHMKYKCLYWQVNVDPYGNLTYIRNRGCPAVRTSPPPAEASPPAPQPGSAAG